ncbi:alpha/beta hydrolase [Baekduia alba]|uniref:alpha/beta hydrolase n=1 Tax=Baekduia alba TaxID=2997333 RepID=UPI0032C453D4
MRFGLAHLIDPRLVALVDGSRAFYAKRVAGRGPSSWEELRSVRASMAAAAPSNPPAVNELVGIAGRRVPLRIHIPADRAATGVYLEIHGGGFYMGSATASDVRNRQLADALGIAVASVDYRLAPEHPWPAAPDDCETAALWLAEHAEQRFGTTKLAVGGFSAGATLAMTTLLRLRDRGIAFGSAVLQFGTYDLSAQTPAGRLIADEYFLDAYAGAASDRTDPDLSPIYAELTDLPPVLIIVGADDILLEDNLAIAARLSAADVDVDLRIYPGSPHGFTAHPTPMARVALEDIETWLSGHLDADSRC